MKHMEWRKEQITYWQVSVIVCLIMGQRACISSKHLLNFLFHSTGHGRTAVSSLVGVSVCFPLCCYFPVLWSFSLWVLPLPSFWSLFLFSLLCALLTNLPFTWRWCFWARQREHAINFIRWGKHGMIMCSGAWKKGRYKYSHTSCLFYKLAFGLGVHLSVTPENCHVCLLWQWPCVILVVDLHFNLYFVSSAWG